MGYFSQITNKLISNKIQIVHREIWTIKGADEIESRKSGMSKKRLKSYLVLDVTGAGHCQWVGLTSCCIFCIQSDRQNKCWQCTSPKQNHKYVVTLHFIMLQLVLNFSFTGTHFVRENRKIYEGQITVKNNNHSINLQFAYLRV